MVELSDDQIAQFLHRSYTAVDGLWFMKLEETYGFDKALEIDNEVWKVMPKIQARMLKSMINIEDKMEALFKLFTTKLTLDGFEYKTEKPEDGSSFRIIISKCPWYDLMLNSGREGLSAKVGDRICNTEYAGWASEFDENISFQLERQICHGSASCILRFSRQKPVRPGILFGIKG